MKRENKKNAKLYMIAGMAITATLLSGCSLNDITQTETSVAPSTVVPTFTPVAEEVTEEVKINEEEQVLEISDEAFEKAFAKYLKENPIQFGEQLDEAYKIYQDDLREEQQKEQEKKEKERLELIKNVRDITDTDHVKGNKDAQFVLFEYSDYHCPYCTRFNDTTKEFLAENDDVAIVFRAYPAVHKVTAQPLHEVAECIAKESGNDAFWKFTDAAFEEQFKEKDISAKISELKIANSEKILKCYENGEFKILVDNSAKEAVSLGIQGTPGSILKNVKTGEVLFINGAQPLGALNEARKQLLEVK